MAGPDFPPDETPITPDLTPDRPGAFGGGLLRTGNPGNKGGTGRPSNALKAIWAEMLEHKKTIESQWTILGDPTHPQWTSLWSKMAYIVNGLPGKQDDASADDVIPHVHMDL